MNYTDKVNKALEYLGYDEILNIDITQQIRRYDARIIYAEDDGVLVKNDWMFYLSTDSFDVTERLIPLMGEKFLFTAHNDYEVEAVVRRFPDIGKINVCYNAVYAGECIDDVIPFDVRCLDESYLCFVKDTYKTFGDDEYILGRLEAGDLFGAFDENGNIMGFCGYHDDGLLGMLEVLPEYRRKGVATGLMTYLINNDIRRGYIPYSQIHITNESSKQLHRKMGFTLSRTPIFWNE